MSLLLAPGAVVEVSPGAKPTDLENEWISGSCERPKTIRWGSVIAFYLDKNGDYLAIDTSTNTYYLDNFGTDHVEGRATAIEGLVGSVCTTCISREHLRVNCERVASAKVPTEWHGAIGF